MKLIKKLISAGLCLILCASALIGFSACSATREAQATPPIIILHERLTYKNTQYSFDLSEEIKIKLYLGRDYEFDFDSEYYDNIDGMSFLLAFLGEFKQHPITSCPDHYEHVKKEIRYFDDYYTNEEYYATPFYGYGSQVAGRIYNHSEEVTIPSEFFTGNEGFISICLMRMVYSKDPQVVDRDKWICGISLSIYYTKEGTTVTLKPDREEYNGANYYFSE